MDMPVKHKKPSIAAQAAAREARLPKLPDPLLDGLSGPHSAMEVEDLIDPFGKAVLERPMAGGMNPHLGYHPVEGLVEDPIDDMEVEDLIDALGKAGIERASPWPGMADERAPGLPAWRGQARRAG